MNFNLSIISYRVDLAPRDIEANMGEIISKRIYILRFGSHYHESKAYFIISSSRKCLKEYGVWQT